MTALRCTHQGLTAWFGTDDAPAPPETANGGNEQRLVIGVAPATVSNAVHVRYRVDARGMERILYGRLLRTELAEQRQYFVVDFPYLTPGAKVDYSVHVTSAGRSVPAPGNVIALSSRFAVGPPPAAVRSPPVEPLSGPEIDRTAPRLPFEMEFFGRFRIFLNKPPEVIGATPEGLKVDWYPTGGDFWGPRISGKIKAVGGDWMTIRPDGIGLINVRAILILDDGALVSATYGGIIELGESGYTDFLKGKMRPFPPTRHTPRYLTDDPRYLWLNRLQCFGIGEVRMLEKVYIYDAYIAR